MSDYVGVTEAARILRERSRRVSDGFIKRWFDETLCPLIAGRRLIPMGYLHAMSLILRDRRRKQSEGQNRN